MAYVKTDYEGGSCHLVQFMVDWGRTLFHLTAELTKNSVDYGGKLDERELSAIHQQITQ